MTGGLLPVFKSSQQEKVPLQPFRAPAAHRDGVREKEFLRKSLLQEKGEYYLWNCWVTIPEVTNSQTRLSN